VDSPIIFNVDMDMMTERPARRQHPHNRTTCTHSPPVVPHMTAPGACRRPWTSPGGSVHENNPVLGSTFEIDRENPLQEKNLLNWPWISGIFEKSSRNLECHDRRSTPWHYIIGASECPYVWAWNCRDQYTKWVIYLSDESLIETDWASDQDGDVEANENNL
jgi:hypothetical protein